MQLLYKYVVLYECLMTVIAPSQGVFIKLYPSSVSRHCGLAIIEFVSLYVAVQCLFIAFHKFSETKRPGWCTECVWDHTLFIPYCNRSLLMLHSPSCSSCQRPCMPRTPSSPPTLSRSAACPCRSWVPRATAWICPEMMMAAACRQLWWTDVCLWRQLGTWSGQILGRRQPNLKKKTQISYRLNCKFLRHVFKVVNELCMLLHSKYKYLVRTLVSRVFEVRKQRLILSLAASSSYFLILFRHRINHLRKYCTTLAYTLFHFQDVLVQYLPF